MLSPVLALALGCLAASGALASPSKRDTGTKAVVAHHVVGFTFTYTPEDWALDINQAHAAGIDGFALNVGADPWEPDQVAAAYVLPRVAAAYLPLTPSV